MLETVSEPSSLDVHRLCVVAPEPLETVSEPSSFDIHRLCVVAPEPLETVSEPSSFDIHGLCVVAPETLGMLAHVMTLRARLGRRQQMSRVTPLLSNRRHLQQNRQLPSNRAKLTTVLSFESTLNSFYDAIV